MMKKLPLKLLKAVKLHTEFNNYKESEKMKIMKDNEIALVKEILKKLGASEEDSEL